jgi:single-strand DNA-binding protein
MATLNNCRFIGRVGGKPEIKQMNNGKEVASFSLAIDQSYKKDGEKISKTEWIKILVFNEKIINLLKNYVDKGSLIYIEGSIQTRKWTDKENVERYTTEIILQGFNSTIQLLDSKKDGEVSQHAIDKGNGYAPESNHVEENDDGLPF